MIEKIKKMFFYLTTNVECSYCKKILKKALISLKTSHTICCNCKSKLTFCPFCKRDYLQILYDYDYIHCTGTLFKGKGCGAVFDKITGKAIAPSWKDFIN